MRKSVLFARVVSILAVPSLFYACGGATVEQLGPRASFDLNCPPNQLSIVKLDDRTIGVQGCGQRATYIENCGMIDGYGGKHDCTWVLNNDSGRAAQPALPPPGYAQQPPPGMMPLPPSPPVASAKPSPPPQ